MPVGFWGDPAATRYRAAYFEMYPGVWRHGDWILFTERGSCVITGRSDATLNRGGVRLGTSEFYAVVEELDEVLDSLVVHLEDARADPASCSCSSCCAEGSSSTTSCGKRIAGALRDALSPRHVPDTIVAVPAIPRTLTGKKLEAAGQAHPRRRPTSPRSVSPDALANPGLDRAVPRVREHPL